MRVAPLRGVAGGTWMDLAWTGFLLGAPLTAAALLPLDLGARRAAIAVLALGAATLLLALAARSAATLRLRREAARGYTTYLNHHRAARRLALVSKRGALIVAPHAPLPRRGVR